MKPIVKLPNKQHGATLITALVMLVVLTLLVISAINSSSTNLRIAGNMQVQEEAIAAAQQATEQVISNNFAITPAGVTVIVNIEGTPYPVIVSKPTCNGSTPLTNSTPGLPSQCFSSSKGDNTGIIFASGVQTTGTSWCSAQQWEVQTNVTDPNIGGTANMYQGVSLNVATGTDCP